MTFISYAQNFEDVILWRALKHVQRGFYIDVGANDPSCGSVTKAFYDLGWRGVNIEPISEWFEKIISERPRDINLQVAAGAGKGDIILYEVPATGMSTSSKAIAERHKSDGGFVYLEQRVAVRTVTDICKEYNVTEVHFLKADVEGAEKQVLEGIDFSVMRPWIILLEAMLPRTQIETYADWEPLLLSGGYEFVYFDGLNRFYVANEHLDLKEKFQAPPNHFDFFSLDENQAFCQYATRKVKDKLNQANKAQQLAEAQLVAVMASHSWRLMAPFRMIARGVRVLVQRVRAAGYWFWKVGKDG